MKTHDLLFLVLGGHLSLACMSPVWAGEMLKNPGFEGIYTNGTAPNWENQSWGDVKARYSEETSARHSGSKCQKATCTSISAKGGVQLIQRGVAVTYGRRYRISIWMKSPDLGSGVTIGLRKRATPYTFYVKEHFKLTRSWKQYTFEGVSKHVDKGCLLTIYYQSTGTLYLDDVSCVDKGSEARETTFKPTPGLITSEYFGFHMHNLRGPIKVPKQHGKSWRLHDAIVTWADLETQSGRWNFEKFDKIVSKAAREKINILYTLGVTPEWAAARPKERSPYYSMNRGCTSEPRTLADWKNYVRIVATRYRGKIKYYEVWNEPNNKKFFTGSKRKLVELARAAAATLKSVDPSIKILTPGCVGEDGALYLGEYLKLGGAKCADIVSFHFYTWGKPEASLDRIREVRKVMEENGLADRPLWNTETGWKIQANNAKESSLVPYAIASEYLARSHLMYRALGISRFYFYAWDNKSMGLVEGDGEDKPCAAAYARIQNWLTGKAMTACKRDAKGVWRVTLMQGERRHWVIWHPDMRMTIDRPAAGVELQTIHGEVRSIAGTTQLDIGPGPILVSTSAR